MRSFGILKGAVLICKCRVHVHSFSTISLNTFLSLNLIKVDYRLDFTEADELIDYSGGKLKEQVKSLTNGKGVDVIYDPVGGELFDQCMRCIKWYGRILVVGFVGGEIPRVPTNLILLKSCQVIGVFYGSFSARYPRENSNNFDEILNLHKTGEISPLIGAEFRLEEFSDALNCLAKRTATGKIIVNIN